MNVLGSRESVAADIGASLDHAAGRSRIWSDVDLDGDGNRLGYHRLPHSMEGPAASWIPIPVATPKNGNGPRILLMARISHDIGVVRRPRPAVPATGFSPFLTGPPTQKYVCVHASGHFEPYANPGERVLVGQAAGSSHFLATPSKGNLQ